MPAILSFPMSRPDLSPVSVKNLVDLYGKDELIYLGPDEQVSACPTLYDAVVCAVRCCCLVVCAAMCCELCQN